MTDDKRRKGPEKQTERLEVRLGPSLRDRFLSACRNMGATPSDVLRAAMSDYVLRAEAAERQSLKQELTMKIARNPRKTLGMTAAAALSAFLFAAQPSVADEELFASFDTDQDGVLTEAEVNPEVITALDKNHDGEVKLAEFKPYTVVESENDDIRGFPGEDPAREIRVSYSVIDLSEPGSASVNTWAATETIDVNAPEAEVDAVFARLKAKVQSGKDKDTPPRPPVPPTPPRGS